MITGSEQAYRQNRSGLARAGTTRAHYFWPNLILTIDGLPSTSSVVLSSIRIQDRLNAEPNTASFTTLGGTAPAVGDHVMIALGTTDPGSRLFHGSIISVVRHHTTLAQRPTYDVTAVDWTRWLDRRLVTADYEDASVASVVRDLIARFTTGLAGVRLTSGLGTVAAFSSTNERLSVVLTRLAKLVGAVWYIDVALLVHFVTTDTWRPSPRSLTHSNTGFWDFSVDTDGTQIRTRVYNEARGRATQCPIGIPTAAPLVTVNTANLMTFPVLDSSALDVTGGTLRVGSERLTYTQIDVALTFGENSAGTNVTSDTGVGATSIPVDSIAFASTRNSDWVKIDDQYIFFFGSTSPPGTLINVPASGFGAVTAPITAGSAVTPVGMVFGIPAGTILHAQPPHSDVVPYVQVDDTAAQTALAAIEGGDGIYEHVIESGRVTLDALTARATAELVDFNDAVSGITYTTRDPMAQSGLTVTVSLTTPVVASGSFLVHQVEISGFDDRRSVPTAPGSTGPATAHVFPVRSVTAVPIQVTTMMDLLTLGEDAR